MNAEKEQFLRLLGQLPARLTVEQAGWVLNCPNHDVPILVAARLLKPLGNPPPNSIKFFATTEVLELTKDRSWLVKVTTTINQHWAQKNARQRMRRDFPNSAEARFVSAGEPVMAEPVGGPANRKETLDEG